MAIDFPVEIRDNGDTAIQISGDLDSEMMGEALVATCSKLIGNGKTSIILDMSQVNNINSYGIGKILYCNEKMKTVNGKLTISSTTGYIGEILKLLMIDRLIEMN